MNSSPNRTKINLIFQQNVLAMGHPRRSACWGGARVRPLPRQKAEVFGHHANGHAPAHLEKNGGFLFDDNEAFI